MVLPARLAFRPQRPVIDQPVMRRIVGTAGLMEGNNVTEQRGRRGFPPLQPAAVIALPGATTRMATMQWSPAPPPGVEPMEAAILIPILVWASVRSPSISAPTEVQPYTPVTPGRTVTWAPVLLTRPPVVPVPLALRLPTVKWVAVLPGRRDADREDRAEVAWRTPMAV